MGEDTPEALLDALRGLDDPEAIESHLARIVERFPAERLQQAARSRLVDLSGPVGEAALRLVEAFATPELLESLADALEAQPDLAPERAWEAISLLEAAGMLEDRPELAERWADLAETIDGSDPLATLVEQLEEEPTGSWVALQGLGAVEPEVRAEIVAGLADFPTGPGLVAFLRLLAFAHDPTARDAALGALAARGDLDDAHRRAWAEIAHDHPDADVRDRASQILGPDAAGAIAEALAHPSRARPVPVGSLVSALDGEGRGSIVVAARDRGEWVVSTFACDIWRGIVAVEGQVGDGPSIASAVFEEFEAGAGRDFVEDAEGPAFGLLAACLSLCGPATTPSLRYWLERAVGPDFRPRPFGGLVPDPTIVALGPEATAEAARLVLDSSPDWLDRSPLTVELAREVALRSGQGPPDPRRDAGAYRYLFEHRLVDRLEHYRRMLPWMATFWEASADHDLARAALALAWQLSDPQHAVPAHPFTVELTTRSLIAARSIGSG